MSWFKKILGFEGPSIHVSVSVTPREVKYGLPVYEAEIRGQKLGRRDIFVTHNGQQQKIPIEILRAQYHAGLLSPDASILVINLYCKEKYYCGEGTVAGVVDAWESAPLEEFDREDVTRMIQEFSFPDYQITSKAAYSDLKRLYERCDSYYRTIAAHDCEFKRFSKSATKDLVMLLDETQVGWEGTDGKKHFMEEVRRHHAKLIRTETEKKAKKKRQKQQDFERQERLPLIETRNNLINFPHKTMQIEVQDRGVLEIRTLKTFLREGTITPETSVRYRPHSEWMELSEFLVDWMRNKATPAQLSYLRSLQRENKITAEIPLDISRQKISERISALAPNQYDR